MSQLYARARKTLASLCICPDLSEPSLLLKLINIKLSRELQKAQLFLNPILTLCILETPKQVLWHTVNTQMKCNVMLHFIGSTLFARI